MKRHPALRHGSLVLSLGLAALPVWAGDDCDAPLNRWQSREAVKQMAAAQGWQIQRLKIDDGCYEIRATDAQGQSFKAKLDSAFALGKEEVSTAASLMQGRFMQRNFVGVEDTGAYKAIAQIRGQLDELNPGKDGDLLQPRKILGMIPFGNKLEAYFRKYESAADQLKTSMGQLYAARSYLRK